MTRPIHLPTSIEVNKAQTKLAAEINKAKASEVLKKGKLDWSAFSWDLTDLTELSSPAAQRPVALMAGMQTRERYPENWADLLRTLIVWQLEEKSDVREKWNSGTLRSSIKSARRLIDNLLKDRTATDITQVSPAVIEEHLAELIVNKDTGTFSLTKAIIARLVSHGVAPQLSGIKVKAPYRANNSPSHVQASNWSEIVALGTAYQKLRSPESPNSKRDDFDYLRYYTVLASLLVCAPSRVSELWRATSDIIVLSNPLEHVGGSIPKNEIENLDFKLALVWHPVKGGQPVIKPIPDAMQGIALDCVETLRTYGDKARSTARWIMENPAVLPFEDDVADLQECRVSGLINSAQLKRLFGLPEGQNIGSYTTWRSNFRRTIATHRKTGGGPGRTDHYCFRTLEAEWWQLFQKKWKSTSGVDWPYAVNTQTYKLEADRALLLIYEGQLKPQRTYQSKLFLETPSAKGLTNLLGDSSGRDSIFKRLDIRLPDGRNPSIQTHELRHFLNTMAQRAGLPEPVIAAWSGRRNIAQNAVYDHRTDAERLRAHGYTVVDYDEAQVDDLLVHQVGQTFEGTIAPPSVEVFSEAEETVRDLSRSLMISITQFGFCVGDLKSDPCPHAMNCLNCARLVVCKGAAKAKTHIEDKIRRLKSQRNLLRAHVGTGGKRLKNDKILPHMDAQIAGAQDMLLALNDLGIDDGSIIARRDRRGAHAASFADRVEHFAAEQRGIQSSRTAVKND